MLKRSWPVLAEVVFPFVLIRLFLLFIGILTIIYIAPLIDQHQPVHLDPSRTGWPLLLGTLWERFDSGFYLDIAMHGYQGANSLHGMSNWAFFPLYPLLIHLIALPFSCGEYCYLFIGVAISNSAALVAVLYFYRLVRREFVIAQEGDLTREDRLGPRRASEHRASGYRASGRCAPRFRRVTVRDPIGRASGYRASERRAPPRHGRAKAGPSFLNAKARNDEASEQLQRELNGHAVRAVLYFQLFPMSLYLSAVYPESLFIALIIACVYYARLRRWWLAGLLGGLAALTRPQGVLLFVVLGWEGWRARRGWVHFLPLLQIPLGLGLFCLYARWKVGTFWAFQMTERYGWHRTLRNPLRILADAFTHPLPVGPYEWNFYALNILVIIVFFAALIPIFRKLPSIYGVFSLLFLLMPLASGGIDSIARYYMEIFPFFMLLATIQENFEVHIFIIILFSIFLSFSMVLWTLGIYAIA